MARICSASILILVFSGPAFAQRGADHWVGTWAASPMTRGPAPAQPAAGANTAPAPPNHFVNQTVRQVVHTSLGGGRVRVAISNTFGTTALEIGSAHIALSASSSAIVPDTDRTLWVNSKSSFSIPPGAMLLTDPVELNAPAVSDLAVSLYFPSDTGPVTLHPSAFHTTYISKEGDQSAQPVIAEATTSQSYYFITGVDVAGPADAAAVVTFGDSITDGARSTLDANRAWPSVLAQRLSANASTRNIGVLNHGIGGNRLLRDNTGPNALARFDRDVIAQPGVKWVTILEGINDIGNGAGPNATPANAVTADDLIVALRQMIERAHARSIQVIGCTLLPYMGAGYSSEKGEGIRAAVNQWIRTSGMFDAVIDFDAVIRDPAAPTKMKADYDSGDHLHPNDAGYKAMAEAVDPALFR
jgi:lysophospholipase L1-like esterase